MLIDLYWVRSESALIETTKKYDRYLKTIAGNFLHNREDTEEYINDTYMKIWNAIPPESPVKFQHFIGRIARNLALNKYKQSRTKRRGGNETALVLDELEDIISSHISLEQDYENGQITGVINSFLRPLKSEDRVVFVRRYWYAESVPDIAKRLEIGESNVNY